jgi:hypothetical protein|tara:strand:+ start:1361 stop:1588 length:228 start_codon:yes stop_codon:yes gene_type:complete
MKLGKLNYIHNLDKHHAANKGYYRALVFDAVERKYENLIITDSEMKKIRARALKNPEDLTQPSWFDMLIATIRLF